MPTEVNIRSKILLKEILEHGRNKEKANRFMRKLARENIQESLTEFENEFEEHPFTVELAKGRSSENTSNSLGGYGNMFTFFGFYLTILNPIKKLRKALFDKFEVKVERRRFAWYHVTTTIPTIEELKTNGKHELPWVEGKSWIEAAEQGLEGFQHFMHDKKFEENEASRSRKGLQIKNTLRRGAFQNQAYLSAMYNRFVKRIRKK